jgi:hypothetical protein
VPTFAQAYVGRKRRAKPIDRFLCRPEPIHSRYDMRGSGLDNHVATKLRVPHISLVLREMPEFPVRCTGQDNVCAFL